MSTDPDRISLEETTDDSIGDTIREQLGDERPRDEHGRFVLKEAEPEIPAVAEAPPAPVPSQEQGVQPPASWSKEALAHFANLPPDVQRYISDRERERDADYTRKTQEIADIRRFSDEVRPIIERHQPLIAHSGASPAEAVNQLFGMYEFSQRDPAGYLKWAAQSLGVDLAQLTQAPDEYIDPGVAQLRNQLQPLAQQVQSVTQYIEQDRQQRENERINAEITAFASERGQDGNPTHPHFEKVRGEMGRLIGAGISANMQDAYERAVWADPAIREELTRPREEPKAESARKLAAASAKPKGASPASQMATGTIHETIREMLNR